MKFCKPNRNLETEEIIGYIGEDGSFNYKTPSGIHIVWAADGKVFSDFEYNTWNPPEEGEGQTFTHGDKLEIEL